VEVDSPDTPLQPNTPRHQASAGAVYTHARFDAGGRVRWVDGFEWVSGVFSGPVPSYTVVDAQANVPLTSRLALGLDVANLLDDDHYEMFGGDVLGRRALAHLTVSW
jgi:outer membrane receptor protein involved in Fe transport